MPTLDQLIETVDGAIKLRNTLESLVDREGLATVVQALSGVCTDKAYHVSVNWQDEELAERWSQMAGRLDTASAAATSKGLA